MNSKTLKIPHRSYGRSEEISLLMQALEEIHSGQFRFVMISGDCGVGKSTLVRETYDSIHQRRGHLLEVKFEQFTDKSSERPLIQSVQDSIERTLFGDDSQLSQLEKSLAKTFENDLQLLLHFIPEFEKILGNSSYDLPEAQEVMPNFVEVFSKVLRSFAQAEHPLIIFLEDLQWVSSKTLDIIDDLFKNTPPHMMLIGTSQEDSVTSNKKLHQSIQAIDASPHYQQLPLENLNGKTVNHILSDTLCCTVEHCEPLSRFIYEKTKGNPFFISMLLKEYHHKNALTFLHTEGVWSWDLKKLKQIKVDGTLSELIVSRLKQLPTEVIEVIKYAACIGSRFDLITLSLVAGKTTNHLDKHLQTAVRQEMIAYDEPVFELSAKFRFQSDLVQQAALSMASSFQKQEADLIVTRIQNAKHYETIQYQAREHSHQLRATLNQLKQAQDQLVQSEKMTGLNTMVASIAHELNTPLGIIKTLTASLSRDTLEFLEFCDNIGDNKELFDSEFKKFVKCVLDDESVILNNAEKADLLIQKFKQVSVDQSSEEKSRFELVQCVNNTIDGLKPKLKRTNLKVIVDAPFQLSFEGYPGDISQIATNFLINSINHGYEPGDPGVLKFKFETDDSLSRLFFEYSDDGKGASAEVLRRIFEPLFTTRKEKGGTGLGMHVVYNLVTQHLDGSIECQSSPGQGICFSISIPIENAERTEL